MLIKRANRGWLGITSKLVLLTMLSWSSMAGAAPAVVTAPQTDAHSAPFPVAPVVDTVHAGDKLSADETATNGWRRVQLPSGKFGFVPDTDIKVDLPPKVTQKPPVVRAPATPPTPAVPTFEAVDERPSTTAPIQPVSRATGAQRTQLYVGDFSHLAEVVKSDPEVFDLADGIATRHTVSSVAIWGGIFGGLVLGVLARTLVRKETCVGTTCVKSTNDQLENVGGSIFILGPLIGWAIRPTRDDKTRVINAWNTRHPDRPFVDRAGIEVP
jgi:hypothetical protein